MGAAPATPEADSGDAYYSQLYNAGAGAPVMHDTSHRAATSLSAGADNGDAYCSHLLSCIMQALGAL